MGDPSFKETHTKNSQPHQELTGEPGHEIKWKLINWKLMPREEKKSTGDYRIRLL